MSHPIVRPVRAALLSLVLLLAVASPSQASIVSGGWKDIGPCTLFTQVDRSGNMVRAGGEVACNGFYNQISGRLQLKRNGVVVKEVPFIRWTARNTGAIWTTYASGCGATWQAVLVLDAPRAGYATSGAPVRIC